jgi:hypothetical protein
VSFRSHLPPLYVTLTRAGYSNPHKVITQRLSGPHTRTSTCEIVTTMFVVLAEVASAPIRKGSWLTSMDERLSAPNRVFKYVGYGAKQSRSTLCYSIGTVTSPAA